MADAFTFELVSPEKLVFSGSATEVLVPGAEGYFTVMKDHAAFMSTIKPGVVEARLESGEAMKVFVPGGLADVSSSGLTVLAELAIPTTELDSDFIAAQIAAAEKNLASAVQEKKQVAQEKLDQLREAKATLNL